MAEFERSRGWRDPPAASRHWLRWVGAAVLTVAGLGLLIGPGPPRNRDSGRLHPRRLPTLFIIGDSTVHNPMRGLAGWGDRLAAYFDTTKIRVENRARGGRSSRTYQAEGLWDQVLAEMHPGDFVLMQFGHNDGGSVTRGRGRASLRGVGEETQEIVDPRTGAHEVVHTYGWYIRKYIADTKARGGTPIVLAPVPRNIWKGGRVVRASNDYGKWAAEAAQAEGACFLDLNDLVARRYEEAGPRKVKALYFGKDHTHTTVAGAEVTAAVLARALKGRNDCPLSGYLAAPATQAAGKRPARRRK